MALLHLLVIGQFRQLIVCHLDHGLRGSESENDAAFVKRAAGELGFEFELGKVDLREMMELTGDSLETAGRLARHEFFRKCALKTGCEEILLAHHADDQAETVLWNLLRGSHGCRGMDETTEMIFEDQELKFVRPLLDFKKEELRGWMVEKNFSWREDASNHIGDVVRNRLRLEAIPLLSEIALRNSGEMLCRVAQSDKDLRAIAEWAVTAANASDPQGRLHIRVLRTLPTGLKKKVIMDYLVRKGVPCLSANLIGRCTKLLDTGGSHCVNLPGGRRLNRRAGRIFIEEI